MSEMSVDTRAHLLGFWLFISAFGIMFAVLSWLQEANILPPADQFGALAVLCGIPLYWVVARNMTGGPTDE